MLDSNKPNYIDCGICSLKPIQTNDILIVERIFLNADVKRFYRLRADHSSNIRSFFNYMITSNEQNIALNLIIFNLKANPVGIITAEPKTNCDTNMYMWNVGYAILPEYRRRGYASAAVSGLSNYFLQKYPFSIVVLDICMENKPSEGVAKKCGFIKQGNLVYYDQDHMDLGLRYHWYKQNNDERAKHFHKAIRLYRQKAYFEAINEFQQALHASYQPNTLYTDAQIYSNIGMALSSVGSYLEAFNCLMKAKQLGLTNPSIEKELLWLRNKKGLF